MNNIYSVKTRINTKISICVNLIIFLSNNADTEPLTQQYTNKHLKRGFEKNANYTLLFSHKYIITF